jgi:hypothetical protein
MEGWCWVPKGLQSDGSVPIVEPLSHLLGLSPLPATEATADVTKLSKPIKAGGFPKASRAHLLLISKGLVLVKCYNPELPSQLLAAQGYHISTLYPCHE